MDMLCTFNMHIVDCGYCVITVLCVDRITYRFVAYITVLLFLLLTLRSYF